MSSPASANITVADYISLRANVRTGNAAAESRWRYYIIGLMDGIQAVQAPAKPDGLDFCMPADMPISPRFLDRFIEKAIERTRASGELRARMNQPMAMLIALELKRAYPCK